MQAQKSTVSIEAGRPSLAGGGASVADPTDRLASLAPTSNGGPARLLGCSGGSGGAGGARGRERERGRDGAPAVRRAVVDRVRVTDVSFRMPDGGGRRHHGVPRRRLHLRDGGNGQRHLRAHCDVGRQRLGADGRRAQRCGERHRRRRRKRLRGRRLHGGRRDGRRRPPGPLGRHELVGGARQPDRPRPRLRHHRHRTRHRRTNVVRRRNLRPRGRRRLPQPRRARPGLGRTGPSRAAASRPVTAPSPPASARWRCAVASCSSAAPSTGPARRRSARSPHGTRRAALGTPTVRASTTTTSPASSTP